MWIFAIVISLGVMVSEKDDPNIFALDDYHWKNRIILVNDVTGNNKTSQQIEQLLDDSVGLRERDLLIFTMTGSNVLDIQTNTNYKDEKNLRDRYHFKEDQWEMILIGKDGGVKFSTNVPVSNNKVFSIIDVMPMRQEEIRRNKKFK